jgi:hypothetical protein
MPVQTCADHNVIIIPATWILVVTNKSYDVGRVGATRPIIFEQET